MPRDPRPCGVSQVGPAGGGGPGTAGVHLWGGSAQGLPSPVHRGQLAALLRCGVSIAVSTALPHGCPALRPRRAASGDHPARRLHGDGAPRLPGSDRLPGCPREPPAGVALRAGDRLPGGGSSHHSQLPGPHLGVDPGRGRRRWASPASAVRAQHLQPAGRQLALPGGEPARELLPQKEGLDAVNHSPAAYFTSISSAGQSRDLPVTTAPDLSTAFLLMTPNLCDDTHGCTTAAGAAGWPKRCPRY